MRTLFKALIRLYQLTISPLLGQNCRFYPSCSTYCHEAFDKYGFFRASFKCACRILKCNPFHRGGFDPLD